MQQKKTEERRRRKVDMSPVRRLSECAVLLALGTVLSLLRLCELPFGGAVTPASMLPVLLIGYRHGAKYGVGCGAVFGGVQVLLGMQALSYFTTWQSVVAVLLLDYFAAFAVIGAGGAICRFLRAGGASLLAGGLLGCVVRYLCHVVSGATVWAGLSIPTEAAIGYSFAYNVTYMLPETLVLLVTAGYLCAVLDFDRPIPVRRAESGRAVSPFAVAAGALVAAAVSFDAIWIAPHLQDETGAFSFAGLSGVFWAPVIAVSAVAVLGAVAVPVFRVLRAARNTRGEKM